MDEIQATLNIILSGLRSGQLEYKRTLKHLYKTEIDDCQFTIHIGIYFNREWPNIELHMGHKEK